VPQPDPAARPGLVVVLHGGQKPAGGQGQDARLGRLPVQGPAERPGQQIGAGGQLDLVAGVVHAQVAAGRVVDDLQGVHPVADIVANPIPVAGGGGDRADDRSQGQAGGHGLAPRSVSAADRVDQALTPRRTPDGNGTGPQDRRRPGNGGGPAAGRGPPLDTDDVSRTESDEPAQGCLWSRYRDQRHNREPIEPHDPGRPAGPRSRRSSVMGSGPRSRRCRGEDAG
jgi:hypothetical protein